MILNDFRIYVSSSDDRFRKSRLLIVPQRQDRQEITRSCYKQRTDVRIIRVSDAITTNAFMPMPSTVLSHVKDLIRTANEDGKMACVIGLNGYLQLLDSDKTNETHGVLRSILDDVNLHAVFLLSDLEIANSPFSYPRLHEEKSIIVIGNGVAEPAFLGDVVFVRRGFLPPLEYVTKVSIQDFLGCVEDEALENTPVCVFVDSAYDTIPGISQSIRQLFTLKSYMRVFCNFEDNVSDDVLQWLYGALCPNMMQGSALSILQNRFYPNGFSDCTITSPKRIRETLGAEQTALVWMLKKTIPHQTYLYAVLSNENLSLKDFMEFYVCTALDWLDLPQAFDFSEERRKALKEIGHGNFDKDLKSFINHCRDKSTKQVAIWLNNGTKIEKRELLRRVMADQGVEIPSVVRKSYPQLDAYLGCYDLGSDKLNDYFTCYRIQKLKNNVSMEFCQRALLESIPSEVPSRDVIIQRYATSQKTALLVIDGLGAEYIPMILALAQKRGTGVEKVMIGYSRLPTSTKYNQLTWPEERKLQDVKHLDNVIHNGAEAHVVTSAEENLMASIKAIEEHVLPAIEEGLLHYDRLVLTSDHGASRLAVCAWDKELAKTIELPKGANILDWRFCSAPADGCCPETMIPSFCGKFWVIKGYNRLSKPGGKNYELHGGATIEEQLVPVIVFAKGAVFTPKPQPGSSVNGEQLTEKDDFDL